MAREVTIDELEQAIKNGAHLIDVREKWEFDSGHVPNAHHIPLQMIPESMNALPKGQHIFIICQSGGRSMKAANYLQSQGFETLSVSGGTGQWIAAGKPVSFGLE